MTYLLAYLRFEITRALRHRRYLMLTMIVPAALYLSLGRQTPKNINLNGIPFAAYFAVSMMTFAAMGSALNAGGARLAMERTNGWTTQIRITPLSPAAYVATKVLTGVIIAIPGTLLVGLAVVFGKNVSLSTMTWVQLYATIWLAILPFSALGMVLGYALDVDTAQVGTGLFVAASSILGGLFVPLSSFPTFLQNLGKALPTYEMADAARASLSHSAPTALDVLGLIGWTVALGLLFVWLYRRDETSSSA
jgi:ABC-2 type transport system permease protein